MRREIRALVLLAAVTLVSTGGPAWGDNPAEISVTVTVQDISVSATGPIAFGPVVLSSETVSGSGSTVTNDGNVTETYSLKLTDPASWTAVQAAPSDPEEYALLAQFNATAPTAVSFTYADHALSESSVACSASKFDGDQTGASVIASAVRTLWFRFNAPTSTAVTAQQTITVTVTAAAS